MLSFNFIYKSFLITFFVFASIAYAKPAKQFGANHPFALEQLPPGQLKNKIKKLPSATQKRAINWLNKINFTESDVPHMQVDNNGAVLFVDPVFKTSSTTAQATTTSSVKNITFTETFSLHSKPGAPNKVYLDMDGHTVTGTAWNRSSGVTTLYMRPYSEDQDDANFTQNELNTIAEVWRRVSEDFAAFNIDVTTQDPKNFGPNVGHILITPQTDKLGNAIFNCFCGGVAYVNVWGNSNFSNYQPALVFSSALGDAHTISEAASHELGHNLSLGHDGNTSDSYYSGHGSGNVKWAPIMGVGYYAQLTQWSKGEYANANNSEDDLQLIANRLSYRPDDHESSNREQATALVITNNTEVNSTNPVSDPNNDNSANKGIIETRSDTDLFYVDLGDGIINLTVTPAWIDSFAADYRRGTNLDIEISLYDSSGSNTPIAQSNPNTETDATINQQVAAGRYYLAVRGVGRGNPLTDGYTDYASIGQYHINGTIVPPQPQEEQTQNPWQDNQTGVSTFNMNWNYAMGYHFTPQVDGRVTKLGGLFNGTKTVRLFNRSTGAVLAQTQVTAANDWGYTPILPVSVKAGQSYTVAVYLAGSGASYQKNRDFNWPQTYGDIKIESSSYAYTGSNTSARPTNSVLSYMFGQADITFVPETKPWQHNQTGVSTFNINWNYAMGYHFTPQVDGRVTKLGGLFNGTKTVRLFNRSTGAVLAQTQVTATNDWGYTPILPVSVKAGQSYTVAVYLAGSGASYQKNRDFNWPQTYGDIKIESSTYAYMGSNTSIRPTNSVLNYMFGQADIVFSAIQ